MHVMFIPEKQDLLCPVNQEMRLLLSSYDKIEELNEADEVLIIPDSLE